MGVRVPPLAPLGVMLFEEGGSDGDELPILAPLAAVSCVHVATDGTGLASCSLGWPWWTQYRMVLRNRRTDPGFRRVGERRPAGHRPTLGLPAVKA